MYANLVLYYIYQLISNVRLSFKWCWYISQNSTNNNMTIDGYVNLKLAIHIFLAYLHIQLSQIYRLVLILDKMIFSTNGISCKSWNCWNLFFHIFGRATIRLESTKQTKIIIAFRKDTKHWFNNLPTFLTKTFI